MIIPKHAYYEYDKIALPKHFEYPIYPYFLCGVWLVHAWSLNKLEYCLLNAKADNPDNI